jgi:PKD repeat protein
LLSPTIVSGTFTVDVPISPTAAFTANVTSGTAPLIIQFTDASTGTAPLTYTWDFTNDGTTDSIEQNPVHTYAAEGTYTVNLTVTNTAGNDSEEKSGYITVTPELPDPPSVNFIGDNRTGPPPLIVHFTDQSTNSPTSWAWDFENDGIIDSTLQNPTHTYTSPGTYQVNLTASNAGGSAFRLKGNYIQVTSTGSSYPVVDFLADSRIGTVPFTVQFTDLTVTDPTAWAWDFENDGIIDSILQNPTHTYATLGTYQVNLTATNSSGSASRLKANYITVNSPPATPVSAFTANQTSGNAPFTVQFIDQSTGSPTSWIWAFGDGETSATQTPSHTYASAGTYTVNLTVTGPGGTDSEEKAGYIQVVAPSQSTIVITPQTQNIQLGSTGDYSLSITSLPAGFAGYNLSISLSSPASGEITGFTLPAWATLNKSATLPGDSIWFEGVDLLLSVQPGATDVPLGTVTVRGDTTGSSLLLIEVVEMDSDGGGIITPSVINGQVNVYQPLVANFTADNVTGRFPLTVRFSDLSTGSPTSCSWDFGDGSTSNDMNPTHIYREPGQYSVSLTAMNVYGQDTLTKTNYIAVTRYIIPLPGYMLPPTDPDHDGFYEDINGNGYLDFDDVVAFYLNMQWVRDTTEVGIEPYDLNGNGRIDYDDVVVLYYEVLG